MYLDIAYADAAKNGKLNNQEELKAAIIEGAVKRIRPKMMVVLALWVFYRLCGPAARGATLCKESQPR
jgi:hypothetical protein